MRDTEQDRYMTKGDAAAAVATLGAYFSLLYLGRRARKRNEAWKRREIYRINQNQAMLTEMHHKGLLGPNAYRKLWNRQEDRRFMINYRM